MTTSARPVLSMLLGPAEFGPQMAPVATVGRDRIRGLILLSPVMQMVSAVRRGMPPGTRLQLHQSSQVTAAPATRSESDVEVDVRSTPPLIRLLAAARAMRETSAKLQNKRGEQKEKKKIAKIRKKSFFAFFSRFSSFVVARQRSDGASPESRDTRTQRVRTWPPRRTARRAGTGPTEEKKEKKMMKKKKRFFFSFFFFFLTCVCNFKTQHSDHRNNNKQHRNHTNARKEKRHSHHR
jgi:hypothetical protein